MRTRLIVAGVVAALIAGVAFVVVRGGSEGDDNGDGVVSGHMMPPRSMTVDGVEINVHPRSMDGEGATFHFTMDTHQGSLDMDMERARLMVGGTEWPMDSWSGDGPGGHHREGTMRFQPGGAVGGDAQLMMAGFGEPVTMNWGMHPADPDQEQRG